MSLHAHLSELAAKHQALQAEIDQELAHPGSDDLHIAELKRKKLRLKDEIAKVEAQMGEH